jgi:parvulin-like peptidyl-prolyl isomerase
MKFIVLSAFCLSSLYAQTAPQPKPPALPDLPDGTPVASCPDGNLITMGEFRGLLVAANNAQAAGNIQGFLDQWCMVRKMAQLAEEQKLDKESPVKEELLYAQKFTLAQAEIQHEANPIVQMSDEESYYNDHKSNYEQVKTYAIFIAFSDASGAQRDAAGKKMLSRTEAKAKAEALLEQIRKGVDFKKLAKENSDDEISRAKDGFFSDLKATDPLPEVYRSAIFKLKPGETTEVLGQENGNGFYIFRAEDVVFKPYRDVQDQVDRAYKEERFKQWMVKMQSETKATILNPKLTGGK